MIRSILAALIVIFAADAQQPDAASPDNTVFSVTTTLVQVDAVVTDAKGHQVTNLKPGDFTVVMDGKPQPITNFSYVHLDSPDVNRPALSPSPSSPSWIVKPADVHRSMVLLVDDLGLSFESMDHVRHTLRKFIDEQMQPGDLVAIWETGRNNSVFQQFTSDKHVLEAAVENLRWNPRGRLQLDALMEDEEEEHRSHQAAGVQGPSVPPIRGESDERQRLEEDLQVGTLGTLNELLDELRQVGGRKAVVMFSDGLSLLPEIGNHGNTLSGPLDEALVQMMRRLVDKANRSGTVIYAVDARGLQYVRPGRSLDLWQSQQGLLQIAQDTGGTATINSNGYSEAMQSIEEDQNGYYLIGFKAPADIDNGQQKAKPGFHSVHVKLNAAGLRVRSRSGFLGVTDQASLAKLDTPEAQMRAAVQSLFNQSALRVRLTALFTCTPEGQPIVHNLLYFDPRDIHFQTGADGSNNAEIDVVILAFGSGIDPLARLARHIPLTATSAELQRMLQYGLLFSLDVPVQHAGPYQIRVSVRDSYSSSIGSAGQYIDIPDLKRQHIALASLRLDDASAANTSRFDDTNAVLREFHAGARLAFVSRIETDKSSRQLANLEGEIQLYRDGTQILTQPVAVRPIVGESGQVVRGVLQLGQSLQPGQYYLKAMVTDRAGNHHKMATTWADFQVIP
ncbi:MAG: VWA domain-containing protein [Bryobacteraceae bacterium]